MSNPIMERNPYFKAGQARPNQFNQTQYQTDYSAQYAASGFAPQQPAYVLQPESVRMTYRDAMNKTAILLATTLFAGIATVVVAPVGLWSPLAIVGSLIACVLGMVIAFKQQVSAGLSLGYAALEGVALGAITGFADMYLPGIAFQTILATTVIVGVCLALHYSGAVRTTSKGMKYAMIVAIGGIIFALVNTIVMIFGGQNLRMVTVAGIPLGVLLGVLMLFVAAYMLIADFEMVQYAVENQAPKQFAWTCATAIVMTILWIYVEVLRLLMIFYSER
ncbi:Bax inhibitor-1/YccA family protein [Arcanobacterium hippocoleae]|uniref:YccA/Bax inhibitor family protein n=1 Tax=Arcanobacterium hippocoleae TaxID=149017 RepID=A0ABU1T3D4_9ACTO|nr:Bax inhibitor-1/YccA family protein [Arcanobacterium hippocoleae]MDR6939891.1 putative YccA/Bax inhibitor family protein [Arcanobacterium hippocoleae]